MDGEVLLLVEVFSAGPLDSAVFFDFFFDFFFDVVVFFLDFALDFVLLPRPPELWSLLSSELSSTGVDGEVLLLVEVELALLLAFALERGDERVDIEGGGFDVVFLAVVLPVGTADTLAVVAINARNFLRSLLAWTINSLPSFMIFSTSEILRSSKSSVVSAPSSWKRPAIWLGNLSSRHHSLMSMLVVDDI